MVPFFTGGHALIIGVGGDLPCTISDAKGIADILKDSGRCAYLPDQVKLLTGENANKSRILEGLDKLSQIAKEDSIVVIYFSGHGYHVKSCSVDAYYLMPFGYNINDLRDTAISGTEFADKLREIKAQKLLLLLDCCHAGGLSDLKAPDLRFAKAPLPPEAQSLFAQGRGRVIIASSQADELSFAGKPYSAFTLALIDAFCGAGASKKDGYVRWMDLALHTREMVPKKTNNRQHPIADLSQADNFVLAYYAGGEKEPKGLPFAEEPEIEPQPGAWSSVGVFDQRGQIVHGPQTNIKGDVQGSVFSGQFSGPVVPRIPPPPGDFTGREEELEEILKAFDRGATIICIWGTGGIGKTALALVLADKLKSRFTDGQIFLNMEGTSENPLKPADAMAQVIRAFRGYNNYQLPDDQNELKGLYNAVLNGKKVLLLLDNAADDQQVRPLLPPAGCAVLITSRYRFILPGMPEPFALGVMKPKEAIKLLRTICERLTLEQASEMATLCGCLPLALRAAASLLQVKIDMSISTYLDDLRSERTRLQALRKVGVERDLEASLNLSYRRLPEKMARVFRLLSVFPADFDAAAEEVICQDEGHSHLSELVCCSLAEYQRSEGGGRYHLHELVRIFALSKLKKYEREKDEREIDKLYWRYYVYYLSVLSEANSLYSRSGKNITKGTDLFDREEINILAVQEKALQQASETKQRDLKCLALRLSCFYPHLGSIIFTLWLDPQKHIKLLKYSLRAAHRFGNEMIVCVDKWKCSHLCDLGIVYENLGEMKKAIRLHKKQLDIARKNDYKKEVGNAIYQIGRNYADQGYVKEAIKCHKKAVSVFKRGEDYQGIVKSLVAEGISRRYIGEVSRAIRYHKRALNISQEKEYGWGIAYSLNNLGSDYVDQDEIDEALKHYEEALRIDRKTGYRIGEVADLGNIGHAYACKNDYPRATKHLKEAIKISKNIGDRKGEAKAEAILGLVCEKEGNLEDAIKHYNNALKIVEKIGYRRRIGQLYVNLGNAYTTKNKYKKAIFYLKNAIEVAKEIGDQKGEAKAEAMLGIVHFKCKELNKAIECHEKALKIVQDINYRRREGHALNNLGNDYAAIDEHLKAMDYYNQALKIYLRIGNDQGRGNILYNMGLVRRELQEMPKANKCMKSAFRFYTKINNPCAEKAKKKLDEWSQQANSPIAGSLFDDLKW